MDMTTETLPSPPLLLKLLADDLRWALIQALARGDRRVHELVELVRRPANLVSYHLRRLREEAVVTEHRSAADRRDVYYSLAFERLRGLYLAAGGSLHPALGVAASGRSAESAAERRGGSVLFLCTHNSARSQMAEGFLRQLRPDLEVGSAGTEVSRVQPLAIRAMAEHHIDISGQRSKHLSEFKGRRFDYVITVCDRARESCPVFAGDPERIHWSIADPAAVSGDEPTRLRAYELAAQELLTRIRLLLALFEHEGRLRGAPPPGRWDPGSPAGGSGSR
jgi:ArsR family transcriptional regulator, arsenate/arsenite/antimonite-responsive transcriptional repressor / arsenate reductase (thioredoxin)